MHLSRIIYSGTKITIYLFLKVGRRKVKKISIDKYVHMLETKFCIFDLVGTHLSTNYTFKDKNEYLPYNQ